MPPLVRAACIAILAGAAMILPAKSSVAADAATSVLAGSCANCHGTDGRSPGPIPPIAGMPFAVLKAQLESFRAGETQGATVMTRIAKGFTEAELQTLARHFADIKK
jgi:sulfide dehydrogenase cytochrome subunit